MQIIVCDAKTSSDCWKTAKLCEKQSTPKPFAFRFYCKVMNCGHEIP